MFLFIKHGYGSSKTIESFDNETELANRITEAIYHEEKFKIARELTFSVKIEDKPLPPLEVKAEPVEESWLNEPKRRQPSPYTYPAPDATGVSISTVDAEDIPI